MAIICYYMVIIWLLYGYYMVIICYYMLLYGYYMVNNNLVGGAITILKHMSSSIGRMTSHI